MMLAAAGEEKKRKTQENIWPSEKGLWWTSVMANVRWSCYLHQSQKGLVWNTLQEPAKDIHVVIFLSINRAVSGGAPCLLCSPLAVNE